MFQLLDVLCLIITTTIVTAIYTSIFSFCPTETFSPWCIALCSWKKTLSAKR